MTEKQTQQEKKARTAESAPTKTRRPKIKPSRSLYVLAGLLLAVVTVAAFLPALVPEAVPIFDPAFLTIIYGFLSLAVALVTFGVIGDSDALLHVERDNGLFVQVSGSAAGFVVFFYLLSAGLSPHTSLTIYLYGPDKQLLNASDGEVEVTLAGKVRRSRTTQEGSVEFSYVPKTEGQRLLIAGEGWQIAEISPDKCANEGQLLPGACSVVDAHLRRDKPCLYDEAISLISFEEEEIKTDLDIVIKRFAERVQVAAPRADVRLVFSDRLLESGLHQLKFLLERKVEIPRTVCTHLSDIQGWFNRFSGEQSITTALSCDTIYVKLAEEDMPKEARLCAQY